MQVSNLFQIVSTSVLTLSLLLFPTQSTLSQTNQHLNNARDNLQQAGESLEKSVDNVGDAIQEGYQQTETEVSQTADAITDRANWGWLGLLGLLGLFGLAGKNRKQIIEHRYPDRTNIYPR
ncbi:hypothetical protein STA3757_05170 [Stanieria sp. NIES-3757]|nr:hypothetical protein STA3757_05170 [Stanieria sp. NIES-3757]